MNRPVQSSVPGAAAGAAGAAPGPGHGAQPGVPDLTPLVAQAQAGDPEAFRALFRDTQPRLLRYLSALAGEDAEDVASETWLQVARDLHDFTGDYDGFRGWVATIARHRALDLIRQRKRRPQLSELPVEDLVALAASDDTAGTAIDAVTTGAAVALIATLPPDQAEAVLLRVVVGLDAQTAAQVLGKRPGAVRTAAYRGLRSLGRRLQQPDGGRPETIPPVVRPSVPAPRTEVTRE
ncbi:MAG TPA: RNA polymerase sigma factor [Streptosporangiaceae bacterium]|nr:RNA polymerase sigma factor [Streptosporangiaceae bacterium]